jgi:hypothetical protein
MNFPFNDNNVTINTTRVKEYLDKEDCEISERHRKEANEKGVDAILKYVKCKENKKNPPYKEYTRVDIGGMTQEKLVATGMPPPFNTAVTTTTKNSKIIIPNGRNMTIIKQTIHDDDSKNIGIVIRDGKDKPIEVMTDINGKINQLGGGSNGIFKEKYMKYKTKYLNLKLSYSS